MNLVKPIVAFAAAILTLVSPAASAADAAAAFEIGTMRVERHGERGTPVILIPGLASGAWVWKDSVAALDREHRVYAVTLAGFDGHPAVKGDVLDLAAESLRKLIVAENLDRPVLVGHSLGGTLALAFAAAHRDLIGGVVAVDGLPVFPTTEAVPAEERPALAERIRAQFAGVAPAEFEAQQLQYMRRVGVVNDAQAAAIARLTSRSDPRAVADYAAAAMAMDVRALLPKIDVPVLEIVPYFAGDYAATRAFLDEVSAHWPGDLERRSRMSLIDEGNGRQVRMANLAVIASHTVNGVAALHSELMTKTIFADFAELYPDRFTNVTNGIAVRRWLKQSNPGLSSLITRHLGHAWENDLEELERLRHAAEDPEFRREFREIKLVNKRRLDAEVQRRVGIDLDVHSLFDVQVKRIHEYKRQLLNLLYVVTRYHKLKSNPGAFAVPRTVIFAGKAAPGYVMAKGIIKLINNVASVVNADETLKGMLKVVFLPDYDVSLAQRIMPAADLSEQISTAGLEASGTGNMKLSLNGALTIGTLDGANVEIRERVGAENIFIFGLQAQEVAAMKARGYAPETFVAANPDLARTLDLIDSGHFSPANVFDGKPIVGRLLSDGEPYFVLADFAAYAKAQDEVDALYLKPDEWSRKAVLNALSMGTFSSDRSIREYAERIWRIKPVL